MNTIIRRLILGAALGFAGAIAFAAPALADEAQHPGGVVGAVAEVVEVVDQVIPELPEPTKAPDPEPEPTKDPEPPAEPEPADEPGHGTDGHDEPAADEPAEEPAPAETTAPPANPIEAVKDGLGQVVEGVKETVEVITAPVVPTPTPAPVITPTPTPTQQPTTPAPTTDTTTEPAQTTTPQTPAAEVPAAPLDELPVVIGPTAGTGTLLPGLIREPGTVEQPSTGEPECTGDQPADAAPERSPGGDREQARRTGAPTADQPPAPLTPCPTPTGPGTQVDVYAATAPTTSGHVEPIGDLTGGITWPALDRLHHVRARGDLPASRTTHLEPGPA